MVRQVSRCRVLFHRTGVTYTAFGLFGSAMHPSDQAAIGPAAQRKTARQLSLALAHGAAPADVRALVRDSWSRSLDAGVPASLERAPVIWNDDEIRNARESTDWIPLAHQAVAAQRGAYADGGHILCLFDAYGRMLHGEGDPAALDGLQAINFRPGALWTEAVVGTNGPGTALASRMPVHVVGVEHFCAAWHDWHCAAYPIRDQLTSQVLGVVDLSGFREAAHPHTLTLAIAIGVAIEQSLSARDAMRRAEILQQFVDLTRRYPAEGVVAVDRTGQVLAASHAAPPLLHPLAPVNVHVRNEIARAICGSSGEAPREVAISDTLGLSAVLFPLLDRAMPAGGCLVIAPQTIARSVSATRVASTRPLRAAQSTRYTLRDLVGQSSSLRAAQRVAVAAASNALPVLLLGESGTGKELFAQGIHAASARAHAPFIAVNCAALPPDLVESELFGYVGGSFSGARREGQRGKFEEADGGTIFLDELAELPVTAQAKLLRVLQEGEVTRVGSCQVRPIDVRVIAATNADIHRAVETGAVRRDLFYRLGVLAIELPALRERREDIPRLAHQFLAQAAVEVGRSGHRFAPEALAALCAYSWPGNVRELKNLVRSLVALVDTREIELDDLPGRIATYAETSGPEPALLDSRHSAPASPAASDPERERLVQAIESAHTMQEAAALLGIRRSTLYRRLQRYGLRPGRGVR
jgi:transcriptional regulator of acetoin/glycerol metabolism